MKGTIRVGGLMTVRRIAVLFSAAAAIAVTSAGCTSGGAAPDNDDSPATSAPTTEPSSPRRQAEAEASQILREYYRVRDALRKDRNQSVDGLEEVAISTELSAYRRLITDERGADLHQTGNTHLAEFTVQSVSLDNSDPQAGKVPTVQIDVCYDVSGVDLLDADGNSRVEPDRSVTGWVRHTVANYSWASDPHHGWRVASSKDLDREPCAS